jgi:hypothetical protein
MADMICHKVYELLMSILIDFRRFDVLQHYKWLPNILYFHLGMASIVSRRWWKASEFFVQKNNASNPNVVMPTWYDPFVWFLTCI